MDLNLETVKIRREFHTNCLTPIRAHLDPSFRQGPKSMTPDMNEKRTGPSLGDGTRIPLETAINGDEVREGDHLEYRRGHGEEEHTSEAGDAHDAAP